MAIVRSSKEVERAKKDLEGLLTMYFGKNDEKAKQILAQIKILDWIEGKSVNIYS